MQHQALTVLASGIVVDKSKLAALSAADMANFFAYVYSLGKKVIIVERAQLFFTTKELLKQLEEGGEDWPLICQHFDITLSTRECELLAAAKAIRQRLVDAVKAMKAPYAFAELPDDWTIEGHLLMTQQLVRRRGAHDQGYSLGWKTVEQLWNAVKDYWAGNVEDIPRSISIRASGYNRDAQFRKDHIQIGCQQVRRYELEQLAVVKGWAFPA